jgi:hypothetical protein
MSTAAAVVRKEIPAKIKTYLAFGLWIMEKTMTEEEARNKMIEMFIGCETVDAICEKFEAFNEKEMVEKLVQTHKSLKPIKKKTEKKKAIESPDNIVNELVSLATNANVVPAVPENENVNVVPENENVEQKPTEDKKKKRAAPKAKPTEDKAKPTEDKAKPTEDKANVVVPSASENEVPVVPSASENVVPSAPEVKTSDVKKRVVKPKAESVATESVVVPSVVATESVVVPSVVATESVVPSVVKAPRKKATPKAKTEAAVVSKPVEEAVVVATEPAIVSKPVEEAVVVATEPAVVATEPAVVAPANEVKKKKAMPKAKPTDEKAKPTDEKAKPTDEKAKPTDEKAKSIATESVNVVPSTNENEVVTSEVQTSVNIVPSVPSAPVAPAANVNVVPSVPSPEDKKKKPKTKAPVAPAVVESPKNDVGAPEEFEDTELVVKEFVYGTKSYYIDEEETIYEQEGLKKIGKLVNGKLVFDSI